MLFVLFHSPKGKPSRNNQPVPRNARARHIANVFRFWYAFLVVAFGLACGPNLWGRNAALASRMAQSMFAPTEARLQVFVDDPAMAAAGTSERERGKFFVFVLLLWSALGSTLAWAKGQRGKSVDWIGAEIHTDIDHDASDPFVKVQLTAQKTAAILKSLDELGDSKGKASWNWPDI